MMWLWHTSNNSTIAATRKGNEAMTNQPTTLDQCRDEHARTLSASIRRKRATIRQALAMVDYLAALVVGFQPGDTSAARQAVKDEAYAAVKGK
jgi:hypothetical protein